MKSALLAFALLAFALWHESGRDQPDNLSSATLGSRTRRPAVRPVHINGKWLADNSSSTGRYAAEMVAALAAAGRFDLVLHVPADADDAARVWAQCPHVEVRPSRFAGALFEQIYLPVVSAGQMLLNFAGTAPLLKRRQLVTMPDATPFRRPLGFSKTFVLAHLFTYRWLGRIADGLVTESVYSAHELADVLRIAVDRFIVAGGAANSWALVRPARPELPLWDDHYLVVGSAAPHENICKSVAAMVGSGRRVVIVGMSGTRHRAATSGVPDGRAIYITHVTDAELAWLYGHSRAFVLPSTYEGFALHALEAQSFGCPVVCADSAALPEVCHDAALYFDPDDPDMLLAQLDRIESEIGLASEIRRQGLVNAARYSWDDSARKIIEWVETRRHGSEHVV